jgi:hypothetical protein
MSLHDEGGCKGGNGRGGVVARATGQQMRLQVATLCRARERKYAECEQQGEAEG